MKKTQQQPNFVLDDALRHLYIVLRNRGAALLAIRFVHGGKKWEVDTPEEAVRLRRELENADIHKRNIDPTAEADAIRAESVWTPDTFWNFIQGIGPHQTRFVAELLHGRLMDASDLIAKIGIEESALGGVLSGLSKQLKQLNLKPSDLYWVHTDWSNAQRTRMFSLQRAFRLAAEEVGWPEERKV